MLSRKILPVLLFCLAFSLVLNVEPAQAKNKVTVSFTSLSYDGYLMTYRFYSYPLAWADIWAAFNFTDVLVVGQAYSTMYAIMRSLLYFDTHNLSGGRIESARLGIYKVADYSLSAYPFNTTIQNGQPNYPHIPLSQYDFDQAFYSGSGNGGSNQSNDLPINTWLYIQLTELSWINTRGITKLCLRSSRDIGKIAPVSTMEYDGYFASESSYKPFLEVTYKPKGKPLDLIADPVSLGLPTFFVIIGLVVLVMKSEAKRV